MADYPSRPLASPGRTPLDLDGHFRLARTEILPDEANETAVAFLARAHA